MIPKNGKFLTRDDFPPQQGKSITFCVTHDCNLRCKYCYIHKKDNSNMSYETGRRIVDEMFANPHLYFSDPVETFKKHSPALKDAKVVESGRHIVIDFIGGEPLLEIELIDRLTDYILYKNLCLDEPHAIVFHISTNGINYLNKETQDYIRKNSGLVRPSITLDGTRQMHDSCRVHLDGTGSYEQALASMLACLTDFPRASTKVTISPFNLHQVAEGIVHLWQNVNIRSVPANVVFEDVWEEKHEAVYEKQLLMLIDFLLKDNNYLKYHTTLFDQDIGHPLDDADLDNSCGGAAKMIHWEVDGTLYNCIRFTRNSCGQGRHYCLGSLNDGWDIAKFIELATVNRRSASDDECFYCKIASGCSYCIGAEFDKLGSVHARSKSICRMHKVRVKANSEFFTRLLKVAEPVTNHDKIIWLDDDTVDQLRALANIKEQYLMSIGRKRYPEIKMSLEELKRKIAQLNRRATDKMIVLKRKLVPSTIEPYDFDLLSGSFYPDRSCCCPSALDF